MYDILVNILMDFTEELILKIKPSERIIHDTTSHPELLELVRQSDVKGARRKMRFHLEDIVPTLKDLEAKMLAASGGSGSLSSDIGQMIPPFPDGRYRA
jgi:DNA-binding GntR family transcriptional regulator